MFGITSGRRRCCRQVTSLPRGRAPVELGLDVESGAAGFNITTLSKDAAVDYALEISALDEALRAWAATPQVKGTRSSRNGLSVHCSCSLPAESGSPRAPSTSAWSSAASAPSRSPSRPDPSSCSRLGRCPTTAVPRGGWLVDDLQLGRADLVIPDRGYSQQWN